MKQSLLLVIGAIWLLISFPIIESLSSPHLSPETNHWVDWIIFGVIPSMGLWMWGWLSSPNGAEPETYR